jgi:hypothetical protein
VSAAEPLPRTAGARLPSAMVAAGIGCVLLGGAVAAVTGPLDLVKGSWLAAYLVLVCGASSYAIGRAQERLAATPLPTSAALALAACWTAGNAAVVAGTLTGVPLVVDLGGALLLAALAVAFRAVRGAARGPALLAYRCALLVLLLSVPIGLLLSHLRNG